MNKYQQSSPFCHSNIRRRHHTKLFAVADSWLLSTSDVAFGSQHYDGTSLIIMLNLLQSTSENYLSLKESISMEYRDPALQKQESSRTLFGCVGAT